MQCELHTDLSSLEVVNLHCCCAFQLRVLELLYPLSYMEFGMRTNSTSILKLCASAATARNQVDFDWDLIDNCTVQKW